MRWRTFSSVLFKGRVRSIQVMHTQSPRAGTGYEGCSFRNVLQDCFACGVVVVGTDSQIIKLTARAQKLLHLPADQNPIRSLTSLPAAIQSIIHGTQTSGRETVDQTVELSPGTAGATTLSVTAIPAVSGRPGGGVVVLLNDVLLTDKLELEMRRLDRLASIGTLSASMAHEIKNALVPVKTFVELLLERNPSAELAATVRREMDRVDSIVGSILKYAAPAKPAFSSVRLHEILEYSLRLAQHHVEGKLISFDRQFKAKSDLFNGDDHQLEQAFVNLLLNAVEAMDSEGKLTVETGIVAAGAAPPPLPQGNSPSGFLRVNITDTGRGIPHEQMLSIFEPFFTTKTNGTGLGLAVTRRIIEEHHGVISVESQPAKGTTFTVFLPYS
jgi:signal transduction histidine kinase